MKLSICIPVYKTEKYLKACIESAISQNGFEFEIVCVNDGSDDSSQKIISEFNKTHLIKYIKIRNSGLSIARNTAMSAATGEYLLFLDSDDLLVENSLEPVLDEACSNDLDLLMYRMEGFTESSGLEIQLKQMEKRYAQEMDNPGVISGQNLIKLMVMEKCYRQSACGMLLKRSFLKKNRLRFYPSILHEDNLFTYHVLLIARRTAQSTALVYRRRYRPDSIMTRSKTHKNIIGLLICFWKMEELANHYIDNMNFFILSPIRQVREYAKSMFMKLPAAEKEKVIAYFSHNSRFFLDFLYQNIISAPTVRDDLISLSEYGRLMQETISLQKKLISVQDEIIKNLNG